MKVRSLSTSLTLLSLAISTQLYAQNVEQTSTVNQSATVEAESQLNWHRLL
jgi:iron complex outermembrane receptor protein